MTIKYLKWDSDFFNKRVGELFIDNANFNINSIDNFDLLYLKSPIDVSINSDRFRNTFIENKIVFSKNILGSKKDRNTEIKSVHDVDFDLNELYELAFESGKFSRYKLDKNFGRKTFIKLYKIWIDNSVNKTFADDILVYKEHGKIHGLITYKVKEGFAKVGLFGINPKMQGNGIGTKLIDNLEYKLYNQGVAKISIPTQLINVKACSFYYKLGYEVKRRNNN